jgi:hypothetical protein
MYILTPQEVMPAGRLFLTARAVVALAGMGGSHLSPGLNVQLVDALVDVVNTNIATIDVQGRAIRDGCTYHARQLLKR